MSRIQGKTFTDTHQVYAGIDVCKASLDLHVLDPGGDGVSRHFANTNTGIRSLIACLGGSPCRVALEPTGRFHLAVWRALERKGLAKSGFPMSITLTKQGVDYDTGLKDRLTQPSDH